MTCPFCLYMPNLWLSLSSLLRYAVIQPSEGSVVLNESLLRRCLAEGPIRVTGVIAWSALRYALLFGAACACIAIPYLLWAGVPATRVAGSFFIGVLIGLLIRILTLPIGRELKFDPRGYIRLLNDGAARQQWSLDEISDVRIILGPREWTTIEIDIVGARRCPAIRFTAECKGGEREELEHLLSALRMAQTATEKTGPVPNGREGTQL